MLGISILILGAAAAQAHKIASPVFVGGASNKEEKQQLDSLVNSAYAILHSSELRKNLEVVKATYPEIFMRMDANSKKVTNGSIENLIAIVQSENPFRYANSSVSLIGSTDNYTALAGVTGNNRDGSLALGRGHLDNWLSDNAVRKSCAVNTVSHELSHLVTLSLQAFRTDTQPIQDNGAAKNSKQNAVASYLIGTAVQCTWLQAQGYMPKVDFKACVKVFGHRGFNGGRCRQFDKNVAVEWREGLNPEHILQ